MSGCPHDIPAMRVSKGNVRPTTDVSSGHLMYNTDHNYLEIYHSDSNNPTGWRDLIINNKEQIDISGNVTITGDASFTTIRADKILYSNMYTNVGDLPSASTYHGMFAHVHSDGGAYFSHNTKWVQLADLSSVEVNSAAITFLTGLLYDLSLSVDSGAGGISPGQDASFNNIDADGNITAVGDITAFLVVLMKD